MLDSQFYHFHSNYGKFFKTNKILFRVETQLQIKSNV